MYLDRQNLFSNAQAVTVTANSTDVIDLTARRRLSDELNIVVKVGTGFTAAGAGTLQISVVTADNSALTTNPETVGASGAVALADLTAGKEPLAIAIARKRLRRYLGLTYTVATGPMTAGTVTAGLTPDVQDATPYASGLNQTGV